MILYSSKLSYIKYILARRPTIYLLTQCLVSFATSFPAVDFVLMNCVAGEVCLLSNFQNVSGDFCICTLSTFCTMGGLCRKCHSVFSAKYTSFVVFKCSSLQQHITPITRTPRSNSCFVEVCHIANDNKSIFCFLLVVIIILSLPYSLDRVLHDQFCPCHIGTSGQHSNFKAWLDFNLQIQCNEPGKQPKSAGHGRERRRFWYATGSYGAELPAISLNGIESRIEVHPPSGTRVDGASIPRGNDKRKGKGWMTIFCLCATPV